MHTNLAFAALTLIQFMSIIAGKPLLATPLSPLIIADPESHRSSHQTLTLISNSANGTYTALRHSTNTTSSLTQSNDTSDSPEGLIPYRVPGSRTTLFFHSFGPKIPYGYMLQALGLSLSAVLKYTLDGKGKNLIKNGFFVHKHVLPNNDNVTIYVADFREAGRPMNWYALKDTLSGIGDFMTESGRELTALSYEIEVERGGYVGTGHVDYDVAGSSA